MPGTIQVTVFDFNGPSSSSPPSSIFLKLSMGKIEYRTEDNGEFSFPLTSLRDNLIIKLQDANGNQISHTGVVTITIIEKGIWDDIFPLEGGGHVHMRLQFILSKEERNRIRIMRESAVKKKRSASSTFPRSQSLSSINNEVSDFQAIVVPNVVATTGDLAAQSHKEEKEGTSRALSTPNVTDRSEETPSTSLEKKLDTHFPSTPMSLQKSSSTSTSSLLQPVFPSKEKSFPHKPEKKVPLENFSINENKLLQESEVHHNVEAGPTLQKEASPVLGYSKSVIATKSKSVFLKMDSSPSSNKSKRRESLEKTHSSVKKMISAFETSPSQDTRTPIKKPLAEKSQPNKVEIKVPPKGQDLKDSTFPSGPSSKILKNPSPPIDLPKSPSKIMKTGDHSGFDKDLNRTIDSQPTSQLKESRTSYEVIENDLKDALEETNTEGRLKSVEELSGPSAIETATHLKRSDDQDFAETSEERGNGSYLNDSHEMNTLRVGNDSLESISSVGTGPSLDTRTPVKPVAEKSQLNRVKVPLKDQDFKDSTFPSGPGSKILKNPFPLENLPQSLLKIMKTGDHSGFDKDIKEPKTVYTGLKGTYEVIRSNLKEACEERSNEEWLKSPELLSRPSAIETATLLKRSDDQDFAENSKDRGNESYSNDSHDKLESISSFENEGNSYEYCGTLLFANDTRRLCLTTGGKDVMDLLGGKDPIPEDEGKVDEAIGKTFCSYIKSVVCKCNEFQHRVRHVTEAEVKKSEILRKSTSESSGDDSSSGPLGQVIKIAVIVGFGLLVLLTRQSESTRKSKRKGNDNFYTTPYRMDQESLADEEWE